MVNTEAIFTYWEGAFPLVNRICVTSINRVFGKRHIHITPNTLGNYVDINSFPDWVFKTNVGHRSDMIRIFLLKKYGGWWFDCDILLKNNPEDLIKDNLKSYIWKEVVSEQKFAGYGMCPAVLYTPCDSLYINEAYRRGLNFQGSLDADPNSEEGWVNLMRECLVKPAAIPKFEVVIGNSIPFYNMDHYQNWWKCWDGSLRLSNFQYGVQFNTSFIRRRMFLPLGYKELPNQILSLSSVEELKMKLPQSNLAEYVDIMDLSDPKLVR